MDREQQAVIEYLREEIRVLREHAPNKRIRFSDEKQCRLARKAKKVNFGKLGEIASLVTGNAFALASSFCGCEV